MAGKIFLHRKMKPEQVESFFKEAGAKKRVTLWVQPFFLPERFHQKALDEKIKKFVANSEFPTIALIIPHKEERLLKELKQISGQKGLNKSLMVLRSEHHLHTAEPERIGFEGLAKMLAGKEVFIIGEEGLFATRKEAESLPEDKKSLAVEQQLKDGHEEILRSRCTHTVYNALLHRAERYNLKVRPLKKMILKA